ncbi:MAG: phosphotriesterase family protein [Solirubrobacteraceae bacterium]
MAVETISGPLALDDLGPTLMHEHVFVMDPEALQNWGHVFGPLYWDERERVADAIVKLTRVREAGIRTIVDPTAPGLGRYVPRVREVAQAAGLQVIVATGVYAFLELPDSSRIGPPARSRRCSYARSPRASTTPASRRRS